MKLKGVMSGMILFLASMFKARPDHYYSASGRVSNGRSAFNAVSAPRCHTQKYKHGRPR